MITAILLAFVFGPWPLPQANTQPSVSSTDPAYLSCTTWTGKDWTKVAARSAKTAIAESKKGFRAHAEVNVAVENGSCKNTSTLYVASGAGQPFRVAFTELPSASDGNGIHLIGWSPDGDKLLAEINIWAYETDVVYDHIAVVYDVSTGLAKDVPALKEALSRHFGPSCDFEVAIEKWKTNEQVLVKVSKPPAEESDEQRFCVEEPRMFVFDLQTKRLLADQESSRD
jgi:hypothetical protein